MMGKKNKTYVTTMYRWGERDNHSYVIYAGNSKHEAIKEGQSHATNRGGKYSPEVLEFEPEKEIIGLSCEQTNKRKFDHDIRN